MVAIGLVPEINTIGVVGAIVVALAIVGATAPVAIKPFAMMLLLIVVVPVAAPKFNVVAAPNAFIVVWLALKIAIVVGLPVRVAAFSVTVVVAADDPIFIVVVDPASPPVPRLIALVLPLAVAFVL